MWSIIVGLFMVISSSYFPKERLVPKVPLLQEKSVDNPRAEYYA